MILLTAVRLINWYGFTNITAPVGKFTLIAGKNGNGKSVLLDAIKYAAFGDTVFKTVIPRNVRVSEAPSHGIPALFYDFDSAGAQAYLRVATEVVNKLQQSQEE